MQRKHVALSPAPAWKPNGNNCSSSSNRSNALAMTGTRTTVVENTTTGALKLKELVTEGELFFFVINVNDCVTKFKFDDGYGYCHSPIDSIVRATDAVIGRKSAVVCSHCDVSEGCTFNLRDSGAREFIADCDPPSAVIPEHVKPNSVSRLVVTGNVFPSGGDKCGSALLR